MQVIAKIHFILFNIYYRLGWCVGGRKFDQNSSKIIFNGIWMKLYFELWCFLFWPKWSNFLKNLILIFWPIQSASIKFKCLTDPHQFWRIDTLMHSCWKNLCEFLFPFSTVATIYNVKCQVQIHLIISFNRQFYQLVLIFQSVTLIIVHYTWNSAGRVYTNY